MKPAYLFTGHHSYDLTECKVHRIVDPVTGAARIVAYYPKTWEKVGEKVSAGIVKGGEMDLQFYSITEWEEIELEVKPV